MCDHRNRQTRFVVLALAAAMLDGCVMRHGIDLERLGFNEARGTHVELRLDDGLAPARIAGELLDVGDTTLLILAERDSATAEVWSVLQSDVESVRPDWAISTDGVVTGGMRTRYDPAGQAQLRRASRFPYGIPAAVLDRILDASGQTEPRVPARAQASTTAGHVHILASSAAADSFMQIAHAATERYHDRSMAIADGYRKLGPAFPGMGEHWVHPGLIVSGRLDASHPPVLCYADANGATRLVAIAYAVPVPAGQTAPDTPMGRSIWHQHRDDLDAETLLLVHGSPDVDPAAPRLAMFHVWTGLDNPEGMFAQNNWRLPFAQLGLDAAAPSAAAAQALSLITIGEEYYMRLFDVVVEHDTTSRDVVGAGFSHATQRTREWRASIDGRANVGDDDLRALERIWGDLWDGVDASVDARTRERLRSYPGRAGG